MVKTMIVKREKVVGRGLPVVLGLQMTQPGWVGEHLAGPNQQRPKQEAEMADAKDSTPKRGLEWLYERSAQAQKEMAERAEQEAQQPKQMFLPGMDEHMRAMPNYLSRSPLFAPVAPGRKSIHDGTVFHQTETVTLKGWGKQLTEDHADIWLHAIYLASKVPLGQPVVIRKREFLRGLGRSEGGSQFEWLHRGVMALSIFTIAIEARTKDGKTKYSIGTHPSSRVMQMLGGFDYDEETEEYRLAIDPRWRQTFGNREYGFLDWSKRLQIERGQNLAKSLQRLISTSADVVQRFSLEYLKGRAQYSGRMRDFRDALERAMRELERLEIIAGGSIEKSSKGKEQVVWTKLGDVTRIEKIVSLSGAA